MSDTKFVVAGEEFDVPDSFRLGDPVLVREVSGLGWAEFVEEIQQATPSALAGLLAVAVWQAKPAWSRRQVAQWVERIDQADLTVVSPEPPPQTSTEGGGNPTGGGEPGTPRSGTPPA